MLMQISMQYENNEEDARAAVNKGFLKILDNLSSYSYKQSFGGWIRRIMVNTLIDEFRAKKRRQEHFISVDFSDVWETTLHYYDHIDDSLSAEEIRDMLMSIPEKYRVVFNLYELEGYTHKEIAAMIDISERSSKRFLNKSKTLLQSELEKMDHFELLVDAV